MRRVRVMFGLVLAMGFTLRAVARLVVLAGFFFFEVAMERS
jgi:hypothetical protein